jgi:protein-tyrosine-phosphatase
MKKVIFACGENIKRSQMAEAIFNHFSTTAIAESGGVYPADSIDPLTLQVLEEIGISHKGLHPKKFTKENLDNADLIVSFGCLVKSQFPSEKFQEWHVEDPQNLQQFRDARDILVKKIKALILSL